MGKFYHMNIAGLERDLPLCPLNDKLYIAGFVMFSDVELTQAVAMIDSKFYADWGNCKTSYSEKDKRFLNQQYAKYGHYHIEHFLYTLYQMHINELLPDILLSVEKVFVNSISEDKNMFSNVISGQQWIVDMMILDAYLYNSDEIKEDEELSNAYIHILEMMIEQNNEKAAVLLDEFLIH